MIGFECPWCDQQVMLPPDALAAGSVTCAACLTQVDVVVGHAATVQPLRAASGDTLVPLAA